jgi:hypothetical protein
MDAGKSMTRLESSLGQVSYRLRYLAVYGVFLAAFLPAGIKKVSQPVPDSIVTQFSTTWIATFPGTKVSWVVMGIAELVVSALFVISLVTLEWNSAQGVDQAGTLCGCHRVHDPRRWRGLLRPVLIGRIALRVPGRSDCGVANGEAGRTGRRPRPRTLIASASAGARLRCGSLPLSPREAEDKVASAHASRAQVRAVRPR